MSYLVTGWVLQESEARLGARLVLMSLASYAHDDGSKAFPSVGTLARETRLSGRAVQEALKKLQTDGMIVHTGTSPKGTRVYLVVGPFNGSGVVNFGGADSAGVKKAASGGADSAPDPVTNPKTPTTTSAGARKPEKVDKVAVTESEHDLTDGILAAFNETFGTKYAGAGFRRGIIGRVREHPELSLSDHQAIIRKMQARPWWKDDPSPAVIYGNDQTFERALHTPEAKAKPDRQSYD